MDILQIITILIALYGASLSTFLYLRDRSAVKIKVELGMISFPGGIEHRMFIKIINTGRRPVVISSAPALILDNGYSLFTLHVDTEQPRLEEGECRIAWFSFDELKNILQEYKGCKVIRAEVSDTTGRKYKYIFKRNQWGKIVEHVNKS